MVILSRAPRYLRCPSASATRALACFIAKTTRRDNAANYTDRYMKKTIPILLALLTLAGIAAYPHLLHHAAVYRLQSMGIHLKTEPTGNPEFDRQQEQINFVSAACSNNQAVLPWLLRTRFDVNSVGPNGYTALHCAAEAGNLEQIRKLLAHGANSAARTEASAIGSKVAYTPIHLAAAGHKLGAVALLKSSGVNIDEPSASGTPLMISLGVRRQNRFVPPLQALREQPDLLAALRVFQGMGANLRALDEEGNTILHIAMRSHHRPLIETLMAEGGIGLNAANKAGDTPFALFVRSAERVNGADGFSGVTTDLDLIARMIAQGAQVNTSNALGVTPIHAALAGSDLFDLLQQHGADIFIAQGNGRSIWSEMPHFPTPYIIGFADKLAELRTPYTKNGKPGSGPLHVFADVARADLVEYFLKRGVSPDARDDQGRTALHLVMTSPNAAFSPLYNRIDVARALLAAGSDPNARDAAGATPLMRLGQAATGIHSATILQMLIASGADVNAADAGANGPQKRVLDYYNPNTDPVSVDMLQRAGAAKAL